MIDNITAEIVRRYLETVSEEISKTMERTPRSRKCLARHMIIQLACSITMASKSICWLERIRNQSIFMRRLLQSKPFAVRSLNTTSTKAISLWQPILTTAAAIFRTGHW